ncbi:PEP-CTERM sorting domain-containing protein [Coraliomargarita sp. SDUM461003]|uniref:PEP-CTERM sorting domain-containing protein n=1 Tax=Thalassobacterium maritimum TaxID=3041265 RepID=A0ABU1B2G1_9BACT|nr:PEP-CTERM sorting domain-containing protein [Coraliomargarita sp. SDUM461003]MDQ8209780.1 PEP-CTERM sorting domain-containing protein [Coraliomargarita sp. SDUM461003]
MPRKNHTLLSIAFVAATLSSQAATTIVGYSIDDTALLTADTLAADVFATDLTSPAWTLSGNIASNDFINIAESGGMAGGLGDDMAGAFSSGQFIEFTISTTSADSFELDSLLLTLQRSTRGPQDFGVRIDDDGFSDGNGDTGIFEDYYTDQPVGTASDLFTISLAGLVLDSSTSYTFRIAYDDRANSGASSSAGRFYDIAVTVPEPGTYGLLAGCFALGSVMLRRRRD